MERRRTSFEEERRLALGRPGRSWDEGVDVVAEGREPPSVPLGDGVERAGLSLRNVVEVVDRPRVRRLGHTKVIHLYFNLSM